VSRLDQLRGIGPGRRRLLLQRFGSFSGVLAAAREELQASLGKVMGGRVWVQLHPPAEAPAEEPVTPPVDGAEPPVVQ
jgi:hypothetical protein